MVDTYRNFEHLKECNVETKDYEVEYEYNSPILVFTIHGGGIEPGTTEIVKEVAKSDVSWYSFTGKLNRGNEKLHLTSTKFDEPVGISAIEKSIATISIHGCHDEKPIVYVGGLDTQLRDEIIKNLKEKVSNDISIVQAKDMLLEGRSKLNVTNRNKIKAGVQLEISAGARKLMFEDFTRLRGRIIKMPIFYKFTLAIREAIYPYLFEKKM